MTKSRQDVDNVVQHGQLENSGYFWNLKKCDRANCSFNIIMGGRGIGKTFQCLYRARNTGTFIYLRRTDTELAGIANPKYNPFKALNAHFDWNVEARFNGKHGIGEFIERSGDEEQFLGYAGAVSTFGKLRGADVTDAVVGVYDEFMRSKTAKAIKGEDEAFIDMCETISRNRELLGQPPMKWYILSNSRTLNTPLLIRLNLVSVIEKMMEQGRTSYTDKSRDLHIELPKDLPVSEAKRNTSLYKLLGESEYTKHSLDNEFIYDSFENIRNVDLREYTPLVQLDNIYIYQHKYRNDYHACTSTAKCKYRFIGDGIPLFKRNIGIRFHNYMMAGNVTYSDFNVKSYLWAIYA